MRKTYFIKKKKRKKENALLEKIFIHTHTHTHTHTQDIIRKEDWPKQKKKKIYKPNLYISLK